MAHEVEYPITLWLWVINDPVWKRYRTKHHMSEEEAKRLDPNAVRVEGSALIVTGPAAQPPNFLSKDQYPEFRYD